MATLVPSSLRTSRVPELQEKRWLEKVFPANPKMAAGSVICVWFCYLAVMILQNFNIDESSAETLLGPYFLMALVSFVVTWILYRLILFLGAGQISKSIWVLVTLPSIILALGLVQLDRWIGTEYPFFPILQVDVDGSISIIDALVPYLILVVWGGVYLALAKHRQMEFAIANSRNLEKITRESELRALRYQLNPHFIFNALNSVSSLVVDDRNREAEQLIDGLADYMRIVLNDEGQEMVTVAKEIEQQVRYLEIEQVRFPDRLRFEIKIADAVADWRIPALIVQPLIENAIKYGVARSTKEVSIIVEAIKERDRMKLSIRNDGRMTANMTDSEGTGTGLVNVKERLAAVYGPSAALFTGNSEDGMAVATIIVPDESQMLQESM